MNTLLKIFSQLRNFTLDTLFPISCLSCGQDGVWLCSECLERVPLRQEQKCPLCEKKITPGGGVCSECRDKNSIDGLLVASFYVSSAARKQTDTRSYRFMLQKEKLEIVALMIQLFKYRFIKDLRVPLGRLLLRAACDAEIIIPDCIVPVPLHSKRLRWRGFNQSELLAEYLGENLTPGFPIPVLNNALLRQKNTHPQMEIKDHIKRQQNIQNAFVVKKEKQNLIHEKSIWLVDDVATTGSTLFECARILKKSGAASVFAVVIARQEFKRK